MAIHRSHAIRVVACAGPLLLASTCAALAHHTMGGRAPQTSAQGPVSGVGHPVSQSSRRPHLLGSSRLSAPPSLAFSSLAVAGFSHIEAIHNAAHDVRHSLGFPCH